MTPPLLVLSTAYVLKEQMLSAIKTRHANETSYQEALVEWQIATANPEEHPQLVAVLRECAARCAVESEQSP